MKPYKPTNNIAVDMVAACINHAERYHKKVKVIYLRKPLWKLFIEYFKRAHPEDSFSNHIDFDDVTVQRATIFQADDFRYEFEKEVVSV